ncbi:MAG TPA: S9 family peptidase [Thermoanaerobaculia bacterium]|nr:S9 family peptidase [Thermoanaerobaculia bacterium]
MRHENSRPSRIAVLLVASGLAAAFAIPALSQQTHAFTVHDLLAMQRLSSPAVSPDGSSVAFVVRSTDLEADRGGTDLWLVGVDGENRRQLTAHEATDVEPAWSADGSHLYFLSSRSGTMQVWRLPMAGGEPRRVTDLPLDVSNLLISPEGSRISFTMEVFPDCDTLECTTERLAQRDESKASGRTYDQLFVRHWDAWKEGRRSHLFTLELAEPSATPVPVTPGFDADIPSKPFGGSEEIAWSPDGRELVFAARIAGTTEPWSTNFDLYAVPADGSAPPRNLTAANPAWDTHPVFSPDGRSLAYLAMERAGYESDRFRLMLRTWPEGEPREIASDWDRSAGDVQFSHDGRTLLVTAANLGRTSLFAIGLGGERDGDGDGAAVRTLVEGGTVSSPQPAGAGRVVFLLDDLRHPAELHVLSIPAEGSRPAAPAEPRAITDFNAERVAAAEMGEPEQFTFAGWNDETVHGYVVKPARFREGAEYPVAFLIHGGPQGSFGDHFHYRWNPQTYAGAGYAAVMIDFHGSTGYGQSFTDSIRDDWGGKPLEDLRKGLAAALERYPWLDGERVCALGASYGGYMVNWIAGNWPDRFRCLVNHDGLFDNRSMYYSTEELWFPEWDHMGPYFSNPEGHEKHNPETHVSKWQTPMLVIHGALDFRVPLEQGLATFTALQRRGIPSRLLVFPDENHWVLQPSNSIQWHQEVESWLDRWLRDGAGE